MPGSTTYWMPGTVSEVSATLVASTTRRPACGCEDPVLLGGRQPRVQRQDLGAGAAFAAPAASASAVSRISRSPERKTRMSPGPSAASSSTASHDRLDLVADVLLVAVVVLVARRPRPAAGSAPRPGTCARRPRRPARRRRRSARREPLRVDRRRGDDHLEVGPAGQQLLEVAEDEVDVEAALVRLVDDERVVLAQHPVALDLGQQDAVGHQLDQACASLDLVGEAHLVADGRRRASVPSSSAIRSATVRAAIRRGWVCPIRPRDAAAELEADLRQLGGLAGAGLAGHDHHLVVADRGGDVVAALR